MLLLLLLMDGDQHEIAKKEKMFLAHLAILQ